MRYLFKIVFFLVILHVVLDVSHHSYRLFSFPTIQGNFSVKQQFSLLNWNSLCRIRSVCNKLDFLIPHYLYRIVWPLPLFGYDHLFDRIIFRITHTDINYKEHEPYKYFDADGSKEDGLLLNERFNLSNWKFMQFITNGNRDIKILKPEIKGLVNHSKSFLPKDFNIIYSTIYIKSIHQPYKYQGNSKPWTKDPFIKFCEIREKILLHNYDNLYELNNLEIKQFKNKIIQRND